MKLAVPTQVYAAAVLALADRATGVRLSQAAYDRTTLCGPSEHLAPYV
ncbi:hypothetical protein [Nonomuraea aridisoli]|nr:hypothetical protein [Nonomuraea aridisoli]